jgi:ABC-2 type transport system permease protein
MSSQQTMQDRSSQRPGSAASGRAELAGAGTPTWWIVFIRELSDLWIGGKALTLLLIYSIILGIQTYVMATNSELSLIPPKEMVYETAKAAIAVSIFIGLIIGSDSISGERERATLESLLLTPTRRGQIMLGKFLAGISPWPVAMLLTIPYMIALAQGDEILWPAVFWGAILGSLLAPAYTGLGMLVSFWSSSNRTSFLVSLGIYILFLVPAQLPGRAQNGAAGQFLQWINPMAASSHFLSVVFALLILAVMFLYAGPRLSLEPDRPFRLKVRAGQAAALLVAALLIQAMLPWQAMAQQQQPLSDAVKIGIDTQYKVVKTGDKVEFQSIVTNNGQDPSEPVIVAMNVINLDATGDVVDPEDWSPQRTQYISGLAPGESTEQSWIINTILDGDYMVYLVALPEPPGTEITSQVAASSGLHLTVTPFTRLNPVGILPFVLGGPLVMILGMVVVYRLRSRQIDAGAA